MILTEYLNYTRKSESPESYHVWVFLSMVAAVLGKKVWMNCNYFKIFPNMFTTLVSPPGVGKKSTAMRVGRAMVQESAAEVKFAFDSCTPQALMLELTESEHPWEHSPGKFYVSSPLTVIASELVTLLSSGPPMVDFLTDIYDSDKVWEYKTKNQGQLKINNPCLNVLSGMTTEVFCGRIIKDAIAGGFISRSIIVYDDKTRISSPFDLPEQDQQDSRDKVVSRLSEIAYLFGEVTFDPKAKELFEKWYIDMMRARQPGSANIEFQSRKDTHVLKTCLLVAASELDRIITVDHLTAAIELINRIDHNMRYIYMTAGANIYANFYQKVLAALKSAGGYVPIQDLLAVFIRDVDAETFDKQLTTLERLKYIRRRIVVGKGEKDVVEITKEGLDVISTSR